LKKLRIATRKSTLALWQAKHIVSRLKSIHPLLTFEIIPITSSGDKFLDSSLAKIGGKGLFTKELEEALLNNQADIAVHSMKDVPTILPKNLKIAIICQRTDPRDVFISNKHSSICTLPQGATVGTSSLRRQCQLLSSRSDLRVRSLRGNVNTRLKKLDNENFDGIILAAAGIIRLGLSDIISEFIDVDFMLPAAGQGAIGIECLDDNPLLNEILAPLQHMETALCIDVERAMNHHLNGNCQVPIASYCIKNGTQFNARGLIGKPDGTTILKSHITRSDSNPKTIGIDLAKNLLQQGAKPILQSLATPTNN